MSAGPVAIGLDELVRRAGDLSRPSATKFLEAEGKLASVLGLASREVQATFVLNPGSFHNRLGQGGPGGPATKVVFALLGKAEDLDKHTRLAVVQAKQRPDRVIALCVERLNKWEVARIVALPSQLRTKVESQFPGVDVRAPEGTSGAILPADTPEVGCFKGFAADAFRFLAELKANNNKEWFHANDDRFMNNVKQPMRCLVEALGPTLLRIDPALETRPLSPVTMSRISRQNPVSKGPFYAYYWAAFYRKRQGRKHDDVQLLVGISDQGFYHGLYAGESAIVQTMLKPFRALVREHPQRVRDVIIAAGLRGSEFTGPGGLEGNRSTHDVMTDAGLAAWADEEFPRVVHVDSPNDPVMREPAALLAHVIADFQSLWPVFVLMTTADVAAALAATQVDDDSDQIIADEDEAGMTWDQLKQRTCQDEETLQRIRRALERKRQIVLSGPPGTGKTFVALAFAEWFAGARQRVELVQFHPSYGYEDFIEGIRAQVTQDGDRHEIFYDVVDGVFKRICDTARRAGPETKFVLVIDEVNRGNIGRIFGELLLLLEYRDQEAHLTYRPRQTFGVPKNLYLVGTMNTADRSIALVDFALRRRFSFIEMPPSEPVLTCWLEAHAVALKDQIVHLYQRVNQDIDKADYKIGHSHFMEPHTAQSLADLWKLDLKPYLAEYFFPNSNAKLAPIEKDVTEILLDAQTRERAQGPEAST